MYLEVCAQEQDIKDVQRNELMNQKVIPHYPISDLVDLKRMDMLDHLLKDEKQVLPIFIWEI